MAIVDTDEVHNTGQSISWPAVFAGNAVTGGFILILLPLGVAAGLSMTSPYAGESASGSTIGMAAILWLAFVYLFSVSAGGYVAGRLRPRVGDVSTDEVRFRDGINGFVFWGVGMIVSALFTYMTVVSAAGTVTRTAGQAIGGLATGAANAAQSAMPGAAQSVNVSTDYLADLFLRQGSGTAPAQPADQPRSAEDARAEIGRIMTRSAVSGTVEESDKAYLSQLVAQRTGLSQDEARSRVDETLKRAEEMRNAAVQQAQAVAEQARKAGAQAAFWTALASLLTGIAAWYAAQLGGRHRDENRY
jgi:hypothetical protein